MEPFEKFKVIFIYCIPIVLLIGIIPFVQNDYLLTVIYLVSALILLSIKSEKNDVLAFFFGLIGLTISEIFMVGTRVEIFVRNSFFGIMPLWLPFLWAYAFVIIKRCLRVLDR